MLNTKVAHNVFARFLLSGGFNTALTYVLYLLLLNSLSYQISYTISYLSGVALAYFLNRSLVFKSHQGLRSILLFPIVYFLQYFFTCLFLKLLVDVFSVDQRIALLFAIILFVPVNFMLSKKIFAHKNSG